MKIFAKVLTILLLVNSFFSLSSKAQSAQNTEYKLWKLQNNIIEQSFKKIPKGAWVKRKIAHRDGYDIEKDVYIGNLRDGATHKKFYVVEISIAGSINQIWCRFPIKKVFYKGRIYKFRTIKPVKAYVYKDGKVFYISEDVIDNFMKIHRPYSTILFQGQIAIPPNESKKVEIIPVTYITATHKIIKATKIKSMENGGVILVSKHVPFGFVKSGNSSLYDFAYTGGIRKITSKMISKAIPLFNMAPSGFRMPNSFPAPSLKNFYK